MRQLRRREIEFNDDEGDAACNYAFIAQAQRVNRRDNLLKLPLQLANNLPRKCLACRAMRSRGSRDRSVGAQRHRDDGDGQNVSRSAHQANRELSTYCPL